MAIINYSNTAKAALKSFKSEVIKECYRAGYESFMAGPNTGNCHYSYFSTRSKTAAWELGRNQAKCDKAAGNVNP